MSDKQTVTLQIETSKIENAGGMEKMKERLYASVNIRLPNVSLFEAEITKLALEEYPVNMGSIGDEPEWDKNEQYRECWIEGWKHFLKSSPTQI